MISGSIVTMTSLTVIEAAMIEGCLRPVAGVMTLGTLTRVMIGWSIATVAVCTVGEAAVTESHLIPGTCIVAV